MLTAFYFGGFKITVESYCSHEIKVCLLLGRKAMTNLVCFSSRYVQMWKLDQKESWWQKNWSFHIVVRKKTLESVLDCKEIKPVNPKGNKPWKFTGRTDAEAPILCPPDGKSWLIRKDLMLGKTEGRRRRGRQKMRWSHPHPVTGWTWVWVNSKSWW